MLVIHRGGKLPFLLVIWVGFLAVIFACWRFMLAFWLTFWYYTIKQVKFQDNSIKMSERRHWIRETKDYRLKTEGIRQKIKENVVGFGGFLSGF